MNQRSAIRGRTLGRSPSGFTLTELLVVMAIIVILMLLLAPAIQVSREAARRGHCGNNLKQIGLALQSYHSVHNSFPASRNTGLSIREMYSQGIIKHNCNGAIWYVGNGLSWRVMILPFVEQQNLYERFDMDSWWYCMPRAGLNRALEVNVIPIFVCPSDTTKLVRKGPREIKNIWYRAAGTNYAAMLSRLEYDNHRDGGLPEIYVSAKSFRDGLSKLSKCFVVNPLWSTRFHEDLVMTLLDRGVHAGRSRQATAGRMHRGDLMTSAPMRSTGSTILP